MTERSLSTPSREELHNINMSGTSPAGAIRTAKSVENPRPSHESGGGACFSRNGKGYSATSSKIR